MGRDSVLSERQDRHAGLEFESKLFFVPVFSCWTRDDIADVNESAAMSRSVRKDFVC